MIAHVPIGILVPGIVFVAIGAYYLRRAARASGDTDLSRRLQLAQRHTGIVTLGFGILLLVIGIPLIVAVMQVES